MYVANIVYLLLICCTCDHVKWYVVYVKYYTCWWMWYASTIVKMCMWNLEPFGLIVWKLWILFLTRFHNINRLLLTPLVYRAFNRVLNKETLFNSLRVQSLNFLRNFWRNWTFFSNCKIFWWRFRQVQQLKL